MREGAWCENRLFCCRSRLDSRTGEAAVSDLPSRGHSVAVLLASQQEYYDARAGDYGDIQAGPEDPRTHAGGCLPCTHRYVAPNG
jgi:hypothetical protein